MGLREVQLPQSPRRSLLLLLQLGAVESIVSRCNGRAHHSFSRFPPIPPIINTWHSLPVKNSIRQRRRRYERNRLPGPERFVRRWFVARNSTSGLRCLYCADYNEASAPRYGRDFKHRIYKGRFDFRLRSEQPGFRLADGAREYRTVFFVILYVC